MQAHILPKHPHVTKFTHTHTHILQNKFKQPQYNVHPNEMMRGCCATAVFPTSAVVLALYLAEDV
jgi:hypothetical protein